MQFKQGQNREQMFMTSMSEWVAEDSWARIVDRLPLSRIRDIVNYCSLPIFLINLHLTFNLGTHFYEEPEN